MFSFPALADVDGRVINVIIITCEKEATERVMGAQLISRVTWVLTTVTDLSYLLRYFVWQRGSLTECRACGREQIHQCTLNGPMVMM